MSHLGLLGVGSVPAAGGGPTLAYRTFARSSTANITIPATAEAGDVALLFDWSNGGAAVNPSLWEELSEHSGSGFRGMVHAKVLDGGDPGASVTGMTGTTVDKLMLVFSGGWAAYAEASVNGQLIFSDPSSQSVTASGGTPPLLVYGVTAYASGFGVFSTATPAFDATEQGDSRILAGWKLYPSSPADHTIDMGDLGTGNWLASGYLQLS